MIAGTSHSDLLRFDYYHVDRDEPWSLTDGREVNEEVYMGYSDEDRQHINTTFHVAFNMSPLCAHPDPSLVSLLCELNKTLHIGRGCGFTIDELFELSEPQYMREWIRSAIHCKEYSKEILLELYLI